MCIRDSAPELTAKYDTIGDMTLAEKIPALILVIGLLVVGFFPKTITTGLDSYLSSVPTFSQTK